MSRAVAFLTLHRFLTILSDMTLRKAAEAEAHLLSPIRSFLQRLRPKGFTFQYIVALPIMKRTVFLFVFVVRIVGGVYFVRSVVFVLSSILSSSKKVLPRKLIRRNVWVVFQTSLLTNLCREHMKIRIKIVVC